MRAPAAGFRDSDVATISRVSEPRQVIGLVFRGIRAELDRRGLTERVLARLQGEARAALERPPLHGTWKPAALHDQVILAIAQETNRRTVRDVAYAVSRDTTGPFSRPLLKTVLSLFGVSPVSLLKHLDTICGLQMRGVHFTYQAETETSGVVTVTHVEPVDPLQFAVWEGVLSFGKDLFDFTTITVETTAVEPDGRSAQIRVAW